MTPNFDLLAATPPVEGDGGVVGEIFRTFHVDWAFFGSQVVSFLIVAFLLKKFAFGPIQQMLEQRRSRIAEGEAKLKQIEQQLADSERSTAAAIAKANADAARLVEEAKTSAAALSEQKAQEAIASAQQILAKAEAAAAAERAQIKAELKQEFGRLVTATTAQVTGKVLTSDDQARINQEALASVEG
jgi:F-type H+-transporting ATPase subunit b